MIWDKAQELGRMIGQSDEYRALRRAEQSLRGDEDTQKKLDRISTLARQVDTAIAQGQMPDEATTLEQLRKWGALVESGEAPATGS